MQRKVLTSLKYESAVRGTSPIFDPTIAPVGSASPVLGVQDLFLLASLTLAWMEGARHCLNWKLSIASLRIYSKQIVKILFVCFLFCHPLLPWLSFPPSVSTGVSHSRLPTTSLSPLFCWPSEGRGSACGAVCLPQHHKGMCSRKARYSLAASLLQALPGAETCTKPPGLGRS